MSGVVERLRIAGKKRVIRQRKRIIGLDATTVTDPALGLVRRCRSPCESERRVECKRDFRLPDPRSNTRPGPGDMGYPDPLVRGRAIWAVSYTHLTLPTILRV